MEQRLKERLTGAAILVALVVLVVPELFRGHVLEGGAGPAGGGDGGPPLRSYTIDLGGGHSAPMRLAPTATRGLPPAAASAEATAAAAGTTATDTTTSMTSTVPAQPAKPSQEPETAAATARTAVAAKPAVAMKPAVAAKPAAAAKPVATVAHAKAWSVQLGLFTKRVNAERMVRAAHAKGFPADLSQPDAKGRYRVHVAGLSTRGAATTLAARLRAAGLPATAVGPK